MDSLTYYNLATGELLAASQKEGEKEYGDAKEHYEKGIEYFIGALHCKPVNVSNIFVSNFMILVCTADDTNAYKDKIRDSCLRAIENAEKLKAHLTGVGHNNEGNSEE